MTCSADCFDVTVPSPRGLIQFVFSNRGNRDYIASLVRTNGLINYEPPTPAVFAALVHDSAGLVLDLGANTGLFSLLAAAANPMLRVFAFEPVEAVREVLRANISCNPGLEPRIIVEPFGISRANGRFRFFETINDRGLLSTSSSLEFAHAQQVGEYREHTIVTRTLDAWLSTLSGDTPVQLMKIDVEGHEHAVIEGSRSTIRRDRPFIIIEILGLADVEAIDRLLIEDNYLDIALACDVLRHCAEIRFHGDAWNHLLCPAEKASRVLGLCRPLNLRMDYG